MRQRGIMIAIKREIANPLGSCLFAWLLTSSLVLPARADNQVQEIVVMFSTHFDIGYTDLVTNIVTRYRTMFTDNALGLIKESRNLPPNERFTWSVPGWPLQQMVGPDQTSERRTNLLQEMKEGHIATFANPFVIETEALDLEDLVRGLTFSADLARSVGVDLPRAAKMEDVPEHTWSLPTLLKHAGVNFLQIGSNPAAHVIDVPPLFWWEGPDGSRVLTAYTQQYGTPLLPPTNWPYHTWLAMITSNDNLGPPTPAEVSAIRECAARDLPGVRVRFGKMEDFYDAIMAEKNEHIPIVRGDMPDTWIHGIGSMPIGTKQAWDVRPLEGAVAMLDTDLRAAGLNPAPLAGPLARAYENSLLYGEHTFGYSGDQPGGFWYGDEWKQKLAEGKYDRFLKSFDDKRDFIRTTANIVTNALAERMQLLAENVATDGPRIVVFNPLPWERSGEVEVQLPAGHWSGVRDLNNGRTVKLSMVDGRRLRFIAGDVPAGGYKTFQPLAGVVAVPVASSDRGLIENEYFRLKVEAARGGMVSLVDLKTGRELVSSKAGNSFASYCHERFASTNVEDYVKTYARRIASWVEWSEGKPGMPGPDKLPYAQITLTNWTVTLQTSALAKIIVLHSAAAAPLAKSVTLKYTLYESQPYLDMEWAIEDKTPDPIPEGGWLCLPFAMEQPRFKLGRLGSIIDPAKDIITGANRELLCLNSGMTVMGPDGYGVGLCPLDSPLVSLGHPGLWKYSDSYLPDSASIFVNLYNNQWNTDFPLWQEGSWNSRVRLWLVQGDNAEKNLITPSWEARSPLIAAVADRPRGKLPVQRGGLKLSRRGILVTNFGPDPYSDKTLLRVWELAGNSGSLAVQLPADFHATRAVPVNLRGEPAGDAVKITGGVFTFKLAAFTPASFRLGLPSH